MMFTLKIFNLFVYFCRIINVRMEYNTELKRLILPEYGRNIQNMVDYCLTIEDKEERMRCANSIINIMGNMFPYLRDVNDFKHKLWDHVAIMSDFKLDIDFPYEIVTKENLFTRPENLPYKNSRIKYMHYGRTIEEMIERVCDYENEEEKEELIRLIANQMKKSYMSWNKDIVDDKKIFDDLRELSKGKIDINEEDLRLFEVRERERERDHVYVRRHKFKR